MNYLLPAPVEPSSNSLESLTPQQLAEQAGNPDMLASVRAEVCRRLKGNPNKANYLTFRWFLPADDADKADAFDGLMACCWNATKTRNRSGLFPRGYPETKQGDGYSDGGIAQETRKSIESALVERLYDLRTLSAPEIALTALNGGFHTDADVANALRRRVREESKYRFQYGDDEVPDDDEGDALTLFEVTRDNPEPRTNAYSDLVEIIFQEKGQIVEELGEKGWTAWEEILELADNRIAELADNGSLSPTGKDCNRAITRVFERVYGVKERQARTLKIRLLALIKRNWTPIRQTTGPRKSTPDELRAQSVFLPPVVSMNVIRRTSGMPAISRLLRFDDEKGEFGDGWGDNRSSLGRDVPPDEWQEIKARLKGGV